ncbi:Gfo/Idh/MocA family protein [Mesorhizobium sp. A623]
MLNFALVGCGRIARRHAELLGRGQIAGARLAAVCDVVAQKAEKFSQEFDVPMFIDMHEMMHKAEIDVVVVLTESGRHAEHAIALAPYGKHIVVEKPIALTLEDADAMIAACKQVGIRLFVVKQNRFNVPVVKLREAVDAGRFGKLTLGTIRVRWSRNQAYYDQDDWRGTWALDGGVLANQASHHIDLLHWMMGDVETVFAHGKTALVDIEAEDTVVAVVTFASGALGVIETTTAVRPKDLEGSISMLGEAGSVEIGGFAVNELKVWNFTDLQPGDEDVRTRYSVNPPNVYGFGHQAYYHHVVESIIDNVPPMVDGEVGRKSLELIIALYRSIETGREERVSNTMPKIRLGARPGEGGQGVPLRASQLRSL